MTTSDTARSDPRFARLGDLIQSEMARLGVPGVAVGVLHEGREAVAGFGVTSLAHPLPVDPDTLFQIGSITKTFVATVVMRLVEQGRLELDAPVRRYLPDFRLADEAAAAGATVRHLLIHTGGWVGDYFEDFGDGDDAVARYVASMATLPQLTPLGEVWSYNNAAFCLAGRVIEVAANQPFEQVMREQIFEPLGMDLAFFFPAEVMLHRFAVGHERRGDATHVARPWPIPRASNAAGGIATTVRNMLRYARFYLGDGALPDGTRLLAAASMQELQRPQVEVNRHGESRGLAWMLSRADAVRLIGHGGGTNGQISNLTIAPDRGFALIVVTNAGRGGELIPPVTRQAVRDYLGVEQPTPTPIETPPEQLAEYAGRYAAKLTDAELRLENGGLVLHVSFKGGFPKPDSPPRESPPPVRLARCAEDRVVALDPPFKDATGDFLRDAQGRITWLRFGGRIARREPAGN